MRRLRVVMVCLQKRVSDTRLKRSSIVRPTVPTKHGLILTVLPLFAVCLNGCVTAALSTVRYAADSTAISRNTRPAATGDAAAEYRLGASYCCSAPAQLNPAKNTEKATYWLCKSALQGDGRAEYLLGRIYSGDIHGEGVASLLAGNVVKKDRSPAVALVWLKLAAAQEIKGAEERKSKLEAALTDDEKAKAASWATDIAHAPCRWSEVFPSGRS